jgi:hypothetical protein
MVAVPQGSDYRFLYVFLYNKGNGWQITEPTDVRDLSQIMIDNGYEIIHHQEYEEDIVVGSKDGKIVGIAKIFDLWAIDLTDHTPGKE